MIQPSLAGTRVLPCLGLVSELDLVGELIVQLHLRLLRQGITGNSLESQLHIDSLLSTCLKVRYLPRHSRLGNTAVTGENKVRQEVKTNYSAWSEVWWNKA